MYATGERRMPCMRIECVEFDPIFYEELVQANVKFFEDDDEEPPGEHSRLESRNNTSADARSSATARRHSSHNIDDMYA